MLNETNTWIGGTGLERIIAVFTIAGTLLGYVAYKDKQKKELQIVNAERKAEIKRTLENFYLPMQNALKRFDFDKMLRLIQDPEMNIRQHAPYLYFEIIAIWWDFRTGYDKTIPFTYLASDTVKATLKDFTQIFESNKLFSRKYTTYIKHDSTVYTEINALLGDGWGDRFKSDMQTVYQCYNLLSEAIEENINSLSSNLQNW